MSTHSDSTPTVIDTLDEEALEALAELDGLREARRELRRRGGGGA